ncbi:MAG: phosphoglycerate dehydrogenase [Gemmatales bacterium]|nr:phosphoglycerate dehydrogenase [Gemmatales bacterium]MDW8386768.1 phosphoglycerate dehydrogenase [Gemmatales bacterium]
MPRVLICDRLEEAGLEILRRAGLEVEERPGLTGTDLEAALREADGVIVRSGTRLTAPLLEGASRLRAVVRAGVGVDSIDVAAATRRGIVVMNTPSGNTVSTAEHTLAMLLALARHIPAADVSVKQGRWERSKWVGTQLAGKTLGIVGLGRIGREVARRAAAFDMKLIGFDPFLTAERIAHLGVEPVGRLENLLERCDILTLHVPLTEETRHMIGANQLARMKPGAWLINCARGGLVDEAALAEALNAGRIGRAALDVFETEPPPPDHPLLRAPNLICTPHLGASTVEAQRSVAMEAAQLMTDFLIRGIVQCAVNMATVDRLELEDLRPYLNLAWRLGLLHAQMDQGAIRRCTLHYRGELADKNIRLLTAAFAAGLLELHLSGSVNVVNAELLARERGIELIEQASRSPGDFSNTLRVEVETEKKTYIAGGTLFGNQFYRLVQLGPYRLDTYLDGNLLIFSHRDVPGLIGFIGTIFGKHGVNIAQMTVGRQVPGGEAIAVLNLDSPPPDEALAEIRTHPQISSISVVRLPPQTAGPAWLG